MNKELTYNSLGYPGDAEQIKTNCLMQDINGYSHLNSPINIYIRINNLNKIEIEHDNVTVSGSFFLGSTNADSTLSSHGSSISSHGSPISTIQGDITNINTGLSNLNNNKQNI